MIDDRPDLQRIDLRLERVETIMQEDRAERKLEREERKQFRQDIRAMHEKHETIIFGDGNGKKGLLTRTTELETTKGLHSKAIWMAVPIFFGLAIQGVWEAIIGAKPH